ncbi:type II toxin-antitoxin system VapC family toxin [Agromyces sp. H66]|uniref:type II toxin-antitoxin system VapC family toxin n=1 Tax=Agromyces sp. H66 TaxID=2529859 RepID=UPI00145AD5BE|nr:type II toxin-antitoxin system VapC family toxin [Agromyces sp. H66]
MARVIALDASVVIAHLSSRDPHHAAAGRFLRAHLDAEFVMHPLTITEVLVGPMRVGAGSVAEHHLAELGITEWAPPPGAARLARIRVETGLKLPDCCVIDVAMGNRAGLATFDDRLARAASTFAVAVVDLA